MRDPRRVQLLLLLLLLLLPREHVARVGREQLHHQCTTVVPPRGAGGDRVQSLDLTVGPQPTLHLIRHNACDVSVLSGLCASQVLQSTTAAARHRSPE
jgi:hypothetical protein